MRTPAVLLLMLLLFANPAGAAEPLDILVYGATGNVGSLTVQEALDRGHRVTAVSRNPARITARHANLSAVQGDLLDSDSVAGLAQGKDVIIISVRGMTGNKRSAENTIQRVLAKTADLEIFGLSNLPDEIRQARPIPVPISDAPSSGALRAEPAGAEDYRWALDMSFKAAKQKIIDAFEYGYMDMLLTETVGNVSEAARKSGIERGNFRKILKRLKIEPDTYRNAEQSRGKRDD